MTNDMQKKVVVDGYNAIREWCRKQANSDCTSCPFYDLHPYPETPQCEFTRHVVPEGWEPVSIRIADSDSEKKDSEKITNDNVNHPSHYTGGKIEVIDFIEDKELGFHLGNAVKYISRAGRKDADKTVEDLRKAVWYINRQIQRLERGEND